jgi:hypothetical protein
MNTQSMNGTSLRLLFALSTFALVLVLYGSTQPPQPDEGTAAHIFQLAILIFVPTFCMYLATADWSEPVAHVKRLALPCTFVGIALGLLFYLEHYYWAAP